MTDLAARKYLLWGNRVPAPSLDLSFLTGALDASVTFARAAGTATVTNSSGTIIPAGTNVARFDYDPVTLAPRGLLIEEARTNVAFPSVPDGTNWTPTNLTVTTAQTTAPDGANAGTLIVDNVTNGAHSLATVATFAFVLGSTYTFSVFAKAGTAHGLQIFLATAAFGTAWADFDVTAGAGAAGTVGGTVASSAIQNVGNGWYRCSMTCNATVSATAAVMVVALTNNNNAAGRGTTYVGSVTGLYVWGAQAETGPMPSSFIPTTVAVATRPIETASVSPTLSQAAASVVSDAMIPAGINALNIVAALNDATTANRMQQGVVTSRAAVTTVSSGSVNSVANPETGLITFGAPFRFGSSLKAGLYLSSLNGAAPFSTGTSIVFPASLTTIQLGHITAVSQLNGYLRRLRYWPQALSAAQLQRVTT